MKEEYIEIKLPMPTSVNKAYCNSKKGRTKSDEYKGWEKLAFVELKKQTTYKIKWDEWLKAYYTFFTPLYYKNWKKKKEDLDNWIKTLQDFLWHNIKWFKDEYIKTIITEKIDSDKKIVKILIKEIN